MNLGVDLGSTYSSFSTYNKDTHNVDLCRPGQGTPEAIPSIACLDDDNAILTGYDARQHLLTTDPGARTFSAFKMLLTENNEELLQERGYGSDYTPRAIAREFLSQQIDKVLNNYSVEEVENLVICVPEVWTTQTSVRQGKLDGRTILRDICAGLEHVNPQNIRIVSEPAAASAYFAHHYRRTNEKGANFSGSLLIIDYGGGTLDLTLTEVHPLDTSVEIKVLFRTGAGENVQGRTGNAGIAYMEETVRLALKEAGEDASKLIPCNPDFRLAVNQLESRLMAQIVSKSEGHEQDRALALRNAVDECGTDISALLDDHREFTSIRYCGEKRSVTFAHLKRAYDQVVQPELGRCLEETARWMKDHKVNYENANGDGFQVVLVGGFGKVSAGAEAGGGVLPPHQRERRPVPQRAGSQPGIRRFHGGGAAGLRRDDHPPHGALRTGGLFRCFQRPLLRHPLPARDQARGAELDLHRQKADHVHQRPEQHHPSADRLR